jgi:hypothetical protein
MVDMWSFYHFLGEILGQPSDRMQRLTPWILTIIGGAIVLVMAYAWWTAPPV